MFRDLPIAFQRLEAGVLLLGVFYAYHYIGGNWWLFAILLFAVDVSMLGYLAGNRIGAIVYNLGHSLIIPVLLICTGPLLNNFIIQELALIWFAHIGVDRLLGYGLKEASGFNHTHLGTISHE